MSVYLDHAATTPMLPAARAAMAAAIDVWANPSSPHAAGRRARALLEDARRRIAAALDWDGAVVLTGGASEAIAIAMTRARRPARAVSTVEHDAVLRHAAAAVRLPVDAAGHVLPDAIPRDALVAVQQVNSETGVVQAAGPVGDAIRAAGGLWFADCVQGAGKRALPPADLIAVGAHKLGGPIGVGALLVRDLSMLGAEGGQEQGYRGGTENLPAILGFAAALDQPLDLPALGSLRAELDAGIVAAGGEVVARGSDRIATIAAYRMPGISARAQLIRFDGAGFAVSAGSACSSGTLRASPVLTAMGWPEDAAAEVIRVSFGWTTTGDDVRSFLDKWRTIAAGTAA